MPDDFEKAFEAAKEQLQPKPLPFRCLGYDRKTFFFATNEGRQVLAFSGRDLHSLGALTQLAPLAVLEAAWPGKQGPAIGQAADALMRACYTAGIWDPARLRGRGVWEDAGRVVLHLGDRLVVDGVHSSVEAISSRFMYEAGRLLRVETAPALSDADGAKLLDVLQAISWEKPERDARLLLGWIVCAMVCGGLAWRPHLWLTGEAGGGKSWVLDNVVKMLLRGLPRVFQSKSTEAGIRGTLQADALPVIFEEAETQNLQDESRLQHVRDLARAGSSDDGGNIIKGTKEGGAREFVVRSCFCFVSINVSLSQSADESRFAVLGLVPSSEAAFQVLKAKHSATFGPGLAAALLGRALEVLPVIRANAETLAAAIARAGYGRRVGDTLGTLLAAAEAVVSRQVLTAAEADKGVASIAWLREAAAEAKPDPEWRRALDWLLQSEIVVSRGERATVAECVGVCRGFDSGSLTYADADLALRRAGIRVLADGVYLASRGNALARIYRDTPWAAAWGSTLKRAPGAVGNLPVRFTGSPGKGLRFPLKLVLDGET